MKRIIWIAQDRRHKIIAVWCNSMNVTFDWWKRSCKANGASGSEQWVYRGRFDLYVYVIGDRVNSVQWSKYF